MKYINWVFIICVNIWSLLMGFLFPVEAGLVFSQNDDSDNIVAEDSGLVGCDTALLGEWFAMSCFIFKGNQPMMVILCGLIALEEEDCCE